MKYSIENIDNVVTFKINNKNVDSSISPELKEQLLIISQPDIKALLVDLTAVETIDSSGIGALLLAERQLSHQNVPMILIGICDSIRKTMRMLNLSQLFDFFDTTDEALKAVETAKK